jgi:hypothetical protein
VAQGVAGRKWGFCAELTIPLNCQNYFLRPFHFLTNLQICSGTARQERATWNKSVVAPLPEAGWLCGLGFEPRLKVSLNFVFISHVVLGARTPIQVGYNFRSQPYSVFGKSIRSDPAIALTAISVKLEVRRQRLRREELLVILDQVPQIMLYGKSMTLLPS